jgi:hypothetical protein
MDAAQLTEHIAGPIGSMGAAHYFSPESSAAAEAAGLDLGTLYAAGRGGTMGDVSPEEIETAFFFFKPPMVTAMIGGLDGKATPTEAADAAFKGAAAFAVARLGDLDQSTLDGFLDAARVAVSAAPRGRWPLFDGHAARATAENPRAEAFLLVIALRELRGGIHTEAIQAQGLSAATACQLDPNPISFELHGFGDADRVEVSDELQARRTAAEAATDAKMIAILSTLSDAQRDALAAGVDAMAPLIGEHGA